MLQAYGDVKVSTGTLKHDKRAEVGAKKFADVWRELNKALQDALIGKEVSGFFAESAKKERNDLSALINNNLNNDRLIEESKLLISNNMMYFKKAEFYYNGEKLFIQKYE